MTFMIQSLQKKSSLSIILPLCAVIFIDYFALTLSFPLLAPLFSLDVSHGGLALGQNSLTTRNFLYGLTMAVFPIFMFFSSPLLGHLSDQVGRKKTLVLCLCGSIVSGFLSGTAVLLHSFILLFITRIIAGCMSGSVPVAQAAIADMSDESDKTINLSLISIAMTLGFILGPVIGGVLSNKKLVSWFGFETPFFLAGALSILNLVSLSFTYQDNTPKSKTSVTKTWMHLIDPLIKFWTAFFDKKIRNIMLCAFLFILGWNTYLQHLMIHLFQTYHFTSAQLGGIVSWIAIIMTLTMLFIIRILVRHFKTRTILHVAVTLCLVGICIGFMIHTVYAQWLCASLMGCGVGLGYSTIMRLFSDAVSANLQGWIMGISASCMAAGSALAGILTGFLALHSIFAFAALFIIFGTCLYYAYQKQPSTAHSK